MIVDWLSKNIDPILAGLISAVLFIPIDIIVFKLLDKNKKQENIVLSTRLIYQRIYEYKVKITISYNYTKDNIFVYMTLFLLFLIAGSIFLLINKSIIFSIIIVLAVFGILYSITTNLIFLKNKDKNISDIKLRQKLMLIIWLFALISLYFFDNPLKHNSNLLAMKKEITHNWRVIFTLWNSPALVYLLWQFIGVVLLILLIFYNLMRTLYDAILLILDFSDFSKNNQKIISLLEKIGKIYKSQFLYIIVNIIFMISSFVFINGILLKIK